MPRAEKPTEDVTTAADDVRPVPLTLHQRREGAGIPLVLLHGFPLDSRMWDVMIAGLPTGFAVYTVDLPGLGSAPSPEELAQHLNTSPAPTLDLAADGVAAAVADAGLSHAVFIGLSMGGYVALALLETHPELVAGLGLFDTKITADLQQGKTSRLQIAHEVQTTGSVESVLGMATTVVGETTAATRPEVVDQLRDWISEQSPAAVSWSQRAMAARPDRTDALSQFSGPVSVVVGEEDTLSPVAGSRLMADVAQQGSFDIIAGVGHLTAVEAPAEVAELVAALMRRVQ